MVWFPADAVRPGTAGAYASWRTHPLLFPFARGTDRAQRLHVPPDDRATWSGRFAALAEELRVRRDGHQDAALAHLTLLLVEAARLSTSVADQLRASDEPLLAAVFDLSERRMQQARVLLTETSLTVAAISHRVGYPDVSYFIKRFRAEHSVTPGAVAGRCFFRYGNCFSSSTTVRRTTAWLNVTVPTGMMLSGTAVVYTDRDPR